MCIINEFNNLDGKKVTRLQLQKLLEKAKLLKVFEVSTRLSNALKFNKEKSFIISIENPIQTPGLNAADQKLILPSLEYISEPDSEGLNGVSPDDIYSYITDLIINTIKKVGHLPWQKKWTGAGSGGGAKNYVSKKEYTGANFLLNFDIEIDENGNGYLVPKRFIQPYYLTFNQIKDAKASLKKGSKAHRVIYYTMIFDFDNGSLTFKTSDKSKFDEFVKSKQLTKDDLKRYLAKIPVLKYYNVFLADDCIGLTFSEEKPTEKVVNPIEEAQKLIDGYKDAPKYTFVGDKAYYQPSNDVVNMPKIDAFENEASYYCTYFHEIVHSTGAKKRLNRDFSGTFGSKNYAYEELIAELGAVFMCSEAGILFHTVENSAKYLFSWNKRLISALEDDNRFFLKASAQSKKAVNYILQNENPDHTEETKVEEAKTEKVKINPGVSLKTPVRKRSKGNSKNNSQLELFAGLGASNNKDITTDKFSKMTVSELRKFTLDYYNENLKGKKVAIKKHLKEVVFFRGAGRKMLQPMYSEKVAVIEHLEDLIKNSTYNNWGKRKQTDNPTILGYLNFKSKITIDGIKRHIRISVILDNNRKTSLKTFEVGYNKKSGDLPKVAVASPKDGDKKPLSNNKDNKNNTKKTDLSKNGLNAAKKVIEKPSEVKPVSTVIDLNKNSLAYKMANKSEKVDYFDIQDENFKKFLGQIEVKPNESVFISLTGGEGSMKTRMAFQFMNCFAQNYKVGHASIEEHPESVLYYDKAKEYLNTKALNNIHNPEVKSMTDLHKLIQDNDVIVIDSFTKMKEIEKSFEVDKDLRKKYNGKLFLVIFQQTTTGAMRGGSKSQFDADIVLFTEKYEDYTKNYVFATKNRYNKQTGLKYNIFSKQLIGNVPAVKKLSFTVK
ncbi:zincin-like metallopeptidase domain-containing protein [Flavobacterium facile]|uniref:zincin-like metallopeptidase domain-containing protein n=1 Tax=Flavobacterium facile TaxID=2893174 RepID=UPI002E776C33|nr:zincin-like metallopeptidase domain-containing protein [Flavobacterium sp. T-12]